MLLLYNKPPLPRLVLLGRYEDDNADILSATLHDNTGNRKIINAFLDAHTKGGWVTSVSLEFFLSYALHLRTPRCMQQTAERSS